MKRAIRFTPHYQKRVWGGFGLEMYLNRKLPEPDVPYGESWEISARPEAMSIVENGYMTGKSLADLWNEQRENFFGERFTQQDGFPLLFKVLDARDKLSIQVHPPKHLAAQLGGEPKNEMWYIARAAPGAKLYLGLKDGVTQEAFAEAIQSGTVEDLVHAIEPKQDQFIYIPSGRLHAIGAGLLIYEIQQSSDTTYRVYDWNRKGIDGKPRGLHVEQSLKCIDFNDIEPTMDEADGEFITQCEDFAVRRKSAEVGEDVTASNPDECAFFTVIAGEIHSEYDSFGVGEFFMLPREGYRLIAGKEGATYLETSIS